MRKILISFITLVILSCQNNSGKKTPVQKSATVQEKIAVPLVAHFNLYEVDSVFFKFIPDTSLDFHSLKEASKYIQQKWRVLYGFEKENFPKLNRKNKLKIQQAGILFDEKQEYILFKTLKKEEPKTLNGINLLGFFSLNSRDNQLKERIAWYNTYPENLRKSEAGKKTLQKLTAYSFQNNVGLNINDLHPIKIFDSAGKGFLFPGNFLKKEYTIVIFGASWCAPCRLGEWQLDEWLNKIDTSRIGIVGISVDSKRKEWLKALRDDGVWWSCYLLDGAMENSLVKTLNFQSIPRNFLIDSSGRILFENVDIRKVLGWLMKHEIEKEN